MEEFCFNLKSKSCKEDNDCIDGVDESRDRDRDSALKRSINASWKKAWSATAEMLSSAIVDVINYIALCTGPVERTDANFILGATYDLTLTLITIV